MSDIHELTHEVVPLPNGRFAVRAIGSELDPEAEREFASRVEAEAWILDQSMGEDEAAGETGVIRPGDGQGVA